jgi:hypothetical protein
MMAVLSFKKRGKDETLESAPSSLGDLSLNGGNLSMGDLGGGLGTLSKLSDLGQTSGSMSDSLLADAMPRNDKKLQEVEANVNDLKGHMETTDLTTRAMKGEMESIKNDVSQINESIRTLLNVYEAVSQQYNPFVDGSATAPVMGKAKIETAKVDDAKVAQPAVTMEKPAAKTEIRVEEHEATIPFDDDGPLDRIVRPDEDDMPASKEEPAMNILERNAESHVFNDAKPAAVRASAPAIRSPSSEDVYALDQTRRLIDHLMGKICTERAIGNEIGEADSRALDLWMSEFKRLGGL